MVMKYIMNGRLGGLKPLCGKQLRITIPRAPSQAELEHVFLLRPLVLLWQYLVLFHTQAEDIPKSQYILYMTRA